MAPSESSRLRRVRLAVIGRTALILELVGTLAIAAGIALYSPPAGLIAAGAGLLAFGLAAERNA